MSDWKSSDDDDVIVIEELDSPTDEACVPFTNNGRDVIDITDRMAVYKLEPEIIPSQYTNQPSNGHWHECKQDPRQEPDSLRWPRDCRHRREPREYRGDGGKDQSPRLPQSWQRDTGEWSPPDHRRVREMRDYEKSSLRQQRPQSYNRPPAALAGINSC